MDGRAEVLTRSPLRGAPRCPQENARTTSASLDLNASYRCIENTRARHLKQTIDGFIDSRFWWPLKIELLAFWIQGRCSCVMCRSSSGLSGNANKLFSRAIQLKCATCPRVYITIYHVKASVMLHCSNVNHVELISSNVPDCAVYVCVCVFFSSFRSCSHVCTMNNAVMHVWACVCAVCRANAAKRESWIFYASLKQLWRSS